MVLKIISKKPKIGILGLNHNAELKTNSEEKKLSYRL